MKLAVTAALMLLALTAVQPVHAQNVLMINNANRVGGAPDKPETVSITLQLALPAPAMSSAPDMTKAMADTSQSLYDIINHECDVLSAALKGGCRLTRLNIGGNYSDSNANMPPFLNRPNGTSVVNASATATFEIDMQRPAAAEAPATPAAPKP
ncbi:MAG TPA: hypothetical protein VK741_13595 [Acetobacteraceae bacterium]|nr:hypothetical protein [Acetobacteraceae bacterium]